MCDRYQVSSDNSVPAFTHHQNRFKFKVFLIIIHHGPCIINITVINSLLCCIMQLASYTLLYHAACILYFDVSCNLHFIRCCIVQLVSYTLLYQVACILYFAVSCSLYLILCCSMQLVSYNLLYHAACILYFAVSCSLYLIRYGIIELASSSTSLLHHGRSCILLHHGNFTLVSCTLLQHETSIRYHVCTLLHHGTL